MEYDIKDIKKIRLQLGLTQSELAQHTKVSQSLIAKLEAGTLDPSYSNVKKIFDTLDSLKSTNEPTAKELMQKQLITITIDCSVKHAIEKMKKSAISQLPVLDGDKIVGILTESDLLDVISNKHITYVSEIIKDSPPMVSETTSAKVVVNLLKFYSMVLVVEKGKIRGVITKADVLNKMY